MKKIKYLNSILASCIVLSLTTGVSASELETDYAPVSEVKTMSMASGDLITFSVDLNGVDLTKESNFEQKIVLDEQDNNFIEISSSFVPFENDSPTTRDYSYDYKIALEGVWSTKTTFYYKGVFMYELSYDYDLSRSGTSWKITNGRNYKSLVTLADKTDNTLTINRAISVGNFPAEIYGSTAIRVHANNILNLASYTASLTNTVSSTGQVIAKGYYPNV